MRRYLRFLLKLMVLGSVVLGGCRTATDRAYRGLVHDQESQYYWGKGTFLSGNSPVPQSYASTLCQQATDASRPLDRRRVIAAILFADYVKPGYTSRRIGAAIPDFKWLEACQLKPVCIIGGGFPLLLRGDWYVLKLLADEKGQSPWYVWFTLSHKGEDALSPVEADAFLRGKYPGRDVRIPEFVLEYPMPSGEGHVEERHTARGVGIFPHVDGFWGDPDYNNVISTVYVRPDQRPTATELYNRFLDLLAGKPIEAGTKFPTDIDFCTETRTNAIFSRSYFITQDDLRGFEISIPKALLRKPDTNYVATSRLQVGRITHTQNITTLLLTASPNRPVQQPRPNP